MSNNPTNNGLYDPVAEYLDYTATIVELYGLLALTETICADTGWPVTDPDAWHSRNLDAALGWLRDDAEWSVTV